MVAALWPAASVYVHHSFAPTLMNEDLVISQVAGIRNASVDTQNRPLVDT